MKDNEEKKNELFMKMACDLATLSTSKGCGPFGCIIINSETKEIVGKGHNEVLLNKDPTLHAEMVAIKNACSTIDSHILDKTTMYTSCEPCPMCFAAISWARIPIVYYGCTKKDAGNIGFDDSNFYDELLKPMDERQIKMINCSREEGLKTFEHWVSKDGTIY